MGTIAERQRQREAEARRLRDLMRQRKREQAEAMVRPPAGEASRLTERDREFHARLVAACRRTRLLEDRVPVPAYGRQARNTYPAALVRVAMARRSRLRELEEWNCHSHNAAKQFSSLVRHLFARYEVPLFLDTVWFRESPEWVPWFLDVGRGVHIREVPGFLVPYTRRMAHLMMQAPAGLTVEEAIRYGQVLGLGGDGRAFRGVLTTNMAGPEVADPGQQEFWPTVIQWFINHPMLDTAHYGPIVDYIRHRRFVPQVPVYEAGRVVRHVPPDPAFSMRGRTPRALLREVEAWHGRLSRGGRGPQARWQRCGRDREFLVGREEEPHLWTVTEIVDSFGLEEEGRKMRHCVYSYRESCRQGRCAIFSVRRDGVRRVTVELDPAKGLLRQARGPRNRPPDPEEERIIRRWLQSFGGGWPASPA